MDWIGMYPGKVLPFPFNLQGEWQLGAKWIGASWI